MRLSRTGVVLCCVYILISVTLWIYAYFIEKDPKGAFVIAQLPVVFAHAAFWKIGLLDALARLPNIVGWAVLLLPTLLVVYLIGWLIDASVSRFSGAVGAEKQNPPSF